MTAGDAWHKEEATGPGSKFKSLLRESIRFALGANARGGAGRDSSRILKRVSEALGRDSLDEALRQIDQAWRRLPDDAEAIAPIYARLLALEERDYDATLRLLLRIDAPDPDVAALTVRSLLHLRRGDEARQQLEYALKNYCVISDGLLAHVATDTLRHPDSRFAGWVGLSPTLEVVGKLSGQEASSALEVRIDAQTTFTQLLDAAPQSDGPDIHFKLPQLSTGTVLQIACRGEPLLGSGVAFPTDFSLDGRGLDGDRGIEGWVRIGWLPKQPVEITLEDENGLRYLTRTNSTPQAGLRWPFTVDVRRARLRGSRIGISALMPDGRWLPLPDTPLVLKRAAKLPGGKLSQLGIRRPNASRVGGNAQSSSPPATDVIIPVYRGRRETLACIEAVLATAADAAVIVVDDATDDVALAADLDVLASQGRITLLRNADNLGFVASVNRALARNPTHDAVLLNADAVVFGDWLGRLRAAAYRTPRVGTVTPFSNSGTIASYPKIGEQQLSVEEAATLHSLAASTNADLSSDIPVGVGFCLFVRRDCLREVGPFDASLFGKGYGEETDFCLRAARFGWSHRLAADVFVYHAGGRSFGNRRAALLDRSQRLINLRFPGYDRLIANFIAKDFSNRARRNLDEVRLRAYEGRFVLLVTHALVGGVQRFVAERFRDIRAQGFLPLVLRPFKTGDARRCELWTDALDVPNLRYEISTDLDALRAVLHGLNIQHVEIQHFIDLDERVVDIARDLNVPYDVMVHDYAWICPRVTLINGSGRYCGEPAVTVCDACVRRNGSHLGGKTIPVGALRRRSASWLQQARRVTAPSLDAATRLRKYFSIDIDVRANESPSAPQTSWAPPRRSYDSTVRIAVIGAIGEHKGYRVLLNCARDAKIRSLPLEFVVIGYTENDGPLLDTGKVFITGQYSEGEASHLLRRENPDIAFLPSVWPETWCYALDEALAAGLPAMAFDLGAIAERLRDRALGNLLPLGAAPRFINDRLLEFAARMREPDRVGAVGKNGIWESNNMNKAIEKAPDRDLAQNESLSASVQVLPLPPGLYLFSVKAAATSEQPAHGNLRLPAMHVGLGPGVRSEHVEFMSGPSTEGAWLFAQEDLLIARVNGAGGAMILTSVRAPGGAVLSIKVERLDARSEAAMPVMTVAAAPVFAPKPADDASPDKAIPLKIGAHIRARGDMTFVDVPWAGRVSPGLWIESFSISPTEKFDAQDIEYKALTGSGFETPWLSDGKMCGTKGISVPLVGFAVRLKSGPQGAPYDCEYSGYFKSGTTVGPLRNGAPCRSSVANDPLEGIQVHIRKRQAPTKSALAAQRIAKAGDAREPQPAAGNGSGPSFGRYRDTAAQKPKPPTANESKSAKSGPAAKSASPGNRKPDGAALPSYRTVGRRT